MSAFLLSDRHINALLTAYRTEFACSKKYLKRIGKLLVKENYKSINYRYEDKLEIEEFVLKIGEEFSPEQIIRFCNCYEYQTCEHPGWKRSAARIWILELINTMAAKLIIKKKLKWNLE